MNNLAPIYRKLRDEGRVLAPESCYVAQQEFVMGYAKWCIDRVEFGESLPGEINVNFAPPANGNTLVTAEDD